MVQGADIILVLLSSLVSSLLIKSFMREIFIWIRIIGLDIQRCMNIHYHWFISAAIIKKLNLGYWLFLIIQYWALSELLCCWGHGSRNIMWLINDDNLLGNLRKTCDYHHQLMVVKQSFIILCSNGASSIKAYVRVESSWLKPQNHAHF